MSLIKWSRITFLVALILITLFACNLNKNLSQVDAEVTIKGFLANHNRADSPLEAQFNAQSIVRVAPVSQFTENDASTVVKFTDNNYMGNHPFAMKFVFQKTVENKWFLTRLEAVGPPDGSPLESSGWEGEIISANSNLHVPVGG